MPLSREAKQKFGRKLLGKGTGDAKNVMRHPRVKADGTVDKSQYDIKRTHTTFQERRDMEGGMPGNAISEGVRKSVNAERQYQADKKRAEHQQKVKGMLRANNARGAETTTSTRSASPGFRDVVQEERDAKAEAAKAKQGLRKGSRYY